MFLTIKKVFTLLNQKQKWQMFGITLLMCVAGLLQALVVALMYPAVIAITDLKKVNEGLLGQLTQTFLPHKSELEILTILLFTLAALYALVCAYSLFLKAVQQRWIAKARTQLSITIFQLLIQKEYSYHLSHGTSEIQRIVTADTTRSFTLLSLCMDIISSFILNISIISTLMTMDPTLTCVVIVGMLLLMLSVTFSVKRKIKINGVKNQQASTEIYKWTIQIIGGLKSILINKRQGLFLSRFAAASRLAGELGAKYDFLAAMPKLLFENISMAFIFLLMGTFVISGNDISTMLPFFGSFAMAAIKIIPSINLISHAISEITHRMPNLDTVYEILIQNPLGIDSIYSSLMSEEEVQNTAHTQHMAPLKHGIEVQNLEFAYAASPQPLYTNLCLNIGAGQSVAFVGATGSGKTTLADIILGLHKPQKGTIVVDGHNIHEEPLWWAQRVGYVPQHVYLFDDSICANVAFGVPEKDVDHEKVAQCLERAQLTDFIKSLPQKQHTIIGENGIRLSGGQRQRIGIARALYSNPPFLVLDEATSALDGNTEQAIIDAINALAGEKTILIIAHRLSTIKECQKVYRIENQRAKEITWEEC